MLSDEQLNVTIEIGNNVTITCYAETDEYILSALWDILPRPADAGRFKPTLSDLNKNLTLSWTAAIIDSRNYSCEFRTTPEKLHLRTFVLVIVEGNQNSSVGIFKKNSTFPL